jgi:flagellar biosynthetic protein FliO
MVQQSMAVFLVLGLLFGGLWLLRRKSLRGFGLIMPKQPRGVRQLRVIERVSLTPQHSVHLVQVADTLLVVGVSPAGCNSLASLPPVAPAHAVQASSNASGVAQ